MSIHLRIQHRFSDRFSLDVHVDTPHAFVGLTGPSGSGKTSIMHIIAGIQNADVADIRIANTVLDSLPPDQRKVGLTMQSPHLFPHLNVEQNLLFGTPSRDDQNRFQETVQWLEIDDLVDRTVRNLSGGERQRVALGRALMSTPRVLLLDEPFSAVDTERSARIVTRLRDHAEQQNLHVVMASHNTDVLEQTTDHIVEVHCGRACG